MDRFCNQSLGLRIYSLLYLIFIPASASGGKFGDWKALNPSELTLVDLLPRMRSEAKQTQTSGTAGLPFSSLAEAISTAEMRFSLPSVRGTPIGNWLPVKITGFVSPSSMKLNADAEYAMVSVPWRMMKPS